MNNDKNVNNKNKSWLGYILLILDLFLICGALFVAYGRKPIIYAKADTFSNSELNNYYSLPQANTYGDINTPFYSKFNVSQHFYDVSNSGLENSYIYYVRQSYNTLPLINNTFGNIVALPNRSFYTNNAYYFNAKTNSNVTSCLCLHTYSVFNLSGDTCSLTIQDNFICVPFNRGLYCMITLPVNKFVGDNMVLHFNTGLPYSLYNTNSTGLPVSAWKLKAKMFTNFTAPGFNYVNAPMLFDSGFNKVMFDINSNYYDGNSKLYSLNETSIKASDLYSNLCSFNNTMAWNSPDGVDANSYENISLVGDNINCNEFYLSIPKSNLGLDTILDADIDTALLCIYMENLNYNTGNWTYSTLVRNRYFPNIELCFNGVTIETYYNQYVNGYNDGYNKGFDIGYNDTYQGAFNSGYNTGYTDGFGSGVSSVDTQSFYNQGYNVGYTDGVAYARDNVYQEAYNSGYNDGLTESSQDYGFFDLLFTIVNAPVNVLMQALSFSVFGVNVWSMILTLLTLCIVIWLVRKIFGGN